MQTHTHMHRMCAFVHKQSRAFRRAASHIDARAHIQLRILLYLSARGALAHQLARLTHTHARTHTPRDEFPCARALTPVCVVHSPGCCRLPSSLRVDRVFRFFFVGLRYCFQANLSFGGFRKCTRFTIHRTNRTKPTYSLLHLCPIRANRFATFFLYFPNVFVCH